MSVIAWEGRSRSGLRIPSELPDLDIESSIDRSCAVPEGGCLLAPKEPEYLPTRVVYPWGFIEIPITWDNLPCPYPL